MTTSPDNLSRIRSAGTTSTTTFSTLRDKLGRALSPNRDEALGQRRISLGRTMTDVDSIRGRQISTGRGGVGNIVRSPSRGQSVDAIPGVERGRELSPLGGAGGDRVTHSGRGGAGNIRSPSRHRDPVAENREESLQAALVAESRGRQTHISTGRGGVGNINDSRSRSRSEARGASVGANGTSVREGSLSRKGSSGPPAANGANHEVRHGGRGGFGNIMEGDEGRSSLDREKEEAAQAYEKHVRDKYEKDEAAKPHVVGKGGAGNFQTQASPVTHVDMSRLTLEERQAFEKIHARDQGRPITTGRGGGGNFVSGRDSSQEGGERGRDHKGGVLGSMFRSLSRAAGGREKSSDRVDAKT